MPGRLRVRVPDRRRDAAFFAAAAAHLAACPGITAVEANALTGSLLIAHTVDAEAIDGYAHAGKLFTLAAPSGTAAAAGAPVTPPVTPPLTPPVSPPSEQWLAAIVDFNRRFTTASEGRGDLRTMLAAFFLMVAIVQAARGRLAMPAFSALWYALRALSLGRAWPDER